MNKLSQLAIVMLLLTGMSTLGVAQESAKESQAPAEETEELGAVEPAMSDLMTELVELRAEVLKLQQTLDSTMNAVIVELREENQRLRRELRNAYGKGNLVLPATPIPGDELRDAIIEEINTDQEPATWTPSTTEDGNVMDKPGLSMAPGGGGPVLYYDVVSEWGRSPEEAADEGDDITSLKGMICAVAPNASDADLAALGRLLRNQYDAYDNINIEVFDDIEAAQRFGKDPSGAAEHRVLSISKHRASERDVILLIKGDAIVTVPREAEAPLQTTD